MHRRPRPPQYLPRADSWMDYLQCQCICPDWFCDGAEWIYFNLIKPSVVGKFNISDLMSLSCSDWLHHAIGRTRLLLLLLLSHGEAHLGILDYHLPSSEETPRSHVRPHMDSDRCRHHLQRRMEPYACNDLETWEPKRCHRKSSPSPTG